MQVYSDSILILQYRGKLHAMLGQGLQYNQQNDSFQP